MAQPLPLGPYKTLDVDGQPAPWYIIPFDKSGTCTGPLTRQHLVDAVRGGDYTDVFIFSHGWNNDWETSSKRYDGFVESYVKLRKTHGLDYGRPHRPLLAGVFWPSTALVAPWEQGPDFAAGDRDAQVAETLRAVDDLAALVAPDRRERFYALAQLDRPLEPGELDELASLLAPVWAELQRNDAADDAPAAAQGAQGAPAALKEVWRDLAAARPAAAPADDGAWGFADDGGGGATQADEPASAGLLDVLLKPRDIVRTFTVLQMKDRGATVGARGVGPLLRDVLAASPTARVHLLGHSYGAVVVLSALSYPPDVDLPRPVDSVLLLQPAVSRWCFAEDVAGKGYPGGYRVALGRVKQPILTTFSKHDAPLTKFFHLAVRRDRDLGQPVIAAAPEVPKAPSRYAALGGFGPEGCRAGECEYMPIRAFPAAYELAQGGPRVIALRSDDAIGGHGDISVPQTWWALYNQVRTVGP
jgi:hypothetical protein